MTVEAESLETGDVLAMLGTPAVRRDPYPLLHRLREWEPVHRTSAGFYLLTRHADVRYTFQHTGDVFLGPDANQLARQYPEAERHQAQRLFLNSMAMKNPPDYGRLRSSVTRALDADVINNLQPNMERIADRLLRSLAEPLRDGAEVDLHGQFALPLSTEVFAEYLGVPVSDSAWLAGLIIHIYIATIPMADENAASYEERFAQADARTVELTDYFQYLFAERGREPRDDLVSALLAAHGKVDDELMAMVWLLWVSGVGTCAAGIDQSLRAALLHPDQTHWLRGTPDEISAFGEEALRLYGSSVHAGIVRIATRDVRFGDVVVPEGSDVRPSCAAANRDPAVFPDPDRFDPARSNQESVAFGHGMRYCPGDLLARAEMMVALARCHAMFPNLVAAGEPTWHDGVATRLVHRLPARLA